jgi:hypothetical protein
MCHKPFKPTDQPFESKPEPFAEPHMMPAGWDLSGLMELYHPTPLEEPQSIPVDEVIQLSVAIELTEKYSV